MTCLSSIGNKERCISTNYEYLFRVYEKEGLKNYENS